MKVDGAGGQQKTREIHDGRILSTGTGAALTFKNVSSGTTVKLRSNGAVTSTVTNPDGTSTSTIIGHVVLIWFRTDVPEGPWTRLYVGRVVTTADPTTGISTLVSSSGTVRDLCAELAR